MKTTVMCSSLLAVVCAAAPVMAQMGAQKVEPLESITSVAPLTERPNNEFRLCTGSAGNAYHDKGLDLSGRMGNALGRDVVLIEGGGTLGCLYKIAAGEVDAMIGQNDGLSWLNQTGSPLLGALSSGGDVLSEALLPFCTREEGEEDFGWLGQSKKTTIALAGGFGSGINITMNAITAEDSDWKKPNVIYAGSWSEAMTLTENGAATCALGVQSPQSLVFEELDDTFGGKLRLLETHDSDFWDVEGLGGKQVYGSFEFETDDPVIAELMDDFMDWNGRKGKASWDVHAVIVNAGIFFRTDAVPTEKRTELRSIIRSQADLLSADFD